MPLPRYGVAIGTFHDFFRDPSHDFGHWYHGHLQLSTPEGVYQTALDVDAPASVGVSYRLVDDLTAADLTTVRTFTDGFHLLAPTPTSGALDYARSPLLRDETWFALMSAAGEKLYRTIRKPPRGAPVFGPDATDALAGLLLRGARTLAERRPGLPLSRLPLRVFPWVSSDGDNALDILEPHVRSASRIYVFGQSFTTGLGVHDVHLNQGDPVGSQWYATDGIWQDGAVLCEHADGRIFAWQIKFNTQTLDTDDNGHPR